MEPQRPSIDKVVLKKRNKAGGITILDLKLHYKTEIIKTVWYWHKKKTHRSIEQNRKSRNEPTTIWSITLQQTGKEYLTWERILIRRKKVSSTNGVSKTKQ